MFDLNNLSIKVWNPANRYFEFIGGHGEDPPNPNPNPNPNPIDTGGLEDPMPALEKMAPVLELLGDAADGEAHCEGSGFFICVQCVNHACAPNVASLKSEDDEDGSAAVYATRDLMPGEEIYS